MTFKEMRERYSAWRLLHKSGDISRKEFESRLADMEVKDSTGQVWRIDIDSGKWLRLDGEDWIADDPSKRKLPSVDIGKWMAANWGSIAVGGMGIVLIGVIVLVVQIIATTGAVASNRGAKSDNSNDQGSGGATTVPVDINTPPTGTPPPTAIPDNTISDDKGHSMVLIEAGAFLMGSTQDEITAYNIICLGLFEPAKCEEQNFESELPAHEVTLDSYYIGQYEVTHAQFAAFLSEQGNQSENGVAWYEVGDAEARLINTSSGWQTFSGYADQPVTEVSWYGAGAYCDWSGGRLPTEAEWEKAARWNPETGAVSRYPWGDTPPNPSLANYISVVGGTSTVGQFPEGMSATGLYDMSGNVFEWVSDWFDEDYYSGSPSSNPQGPNNGTHHTIKGGSWGDFSFLMHAANRGIAMPNAAFNFVGFRCARDIGE